MFLKKNIFVLAVAIFLSCSNFSSALEAQPSLDNQNSNLNFLESLVRNCFNTKNRKSGITYNRNTILDDLNAVAGAGLFVSSDKGLKINPQVFSKLLISCIHSQIVPSIKKTVEIELVSDILLKNVEIPLEDVENLIKSRPTGRSRSTALRSNNIVQDILLNLVITPLKTVVDGALNFATTVLNSFVIDTDNATNSILSAIAGVTNYAVECALNAVTNVQTRLDSFFDLFNTTTTTDDADSTAKNLKALSVSKARDLNFPLNLLSDVIETAVISPIRTAVNNILTTVNDTINSFYVDNSNSTGIQKIWDDIINAAVQNGVSFINTIYIEINDALNNITGTSSS